MKIREFGRLKILDSIRGIAAVIVLFHHIFKLNKETFKETLNDPFFNILKFISGLNKEAVLLFFVISGFSIGLSTFKRPLVTLSDLNTYFYRRLKRILPIYWIAILLSLGIGIIANTTYLKDFSAFNLIGNLLFLQTSDSIPESWFIPYGLNGPLWSLSYEMFFYLLFPFVYFFSKKYLPKHKLYVKYFGLIFLVLAGLTFNKKVIFIPQLLFLTGFIVWILGYISSEYFTHYKKNKLFFACNLVIGFLLIYYENKIPSDSINFISKGMVITSIFHFSTMLFDKIKVKKFEAFFNFLFFKIGEGSYAIYALHYPVLVYFEMKNVSLIYQLIFMPFFFVFCYHLEKKSLKWKLNFLQQNYTKPIALLKRDK